MQSEEPSYVTEYRTKYGTFEQVMSLLSFDKVHVLAADVDRLLSKDVPSFVRLDRTFGEGSSKVWLYSHLKQLFLLLSIDSEQIADVQINQIAAIIAANYPTIKLSEFIWFESKFLGGHYERFFGKTTYFLVITRSLNTFVEELQERYEVMRRENELERQVTVEPGMPLEELQRKMASGEFKNLRALMSSSGKPLAAPQKGELSEVEIATALQSAESLLKNVLGFDEDSLGAACYSFKKRYGMLPEKFIKKYS